MVAKFLVKILGLFLFINSLAWGMLADGIHTENDYATLAQESEIFQAACYIGDEQYHISQTGVLITPTIVATAAHGVVSILQNRGLPPDNKPVSVNNVSVTFTKGDQVFSYEVEKVLVDARYTENSNIQSKYDVALIKLKTAVDEITPAQVFEAEVIPKQAVLTVVSFGMADLPYQPAIKRAFRLYERDSYHVGGVDEEGLVLNRTVLQSSLFFKPDEDLTRPLPSWDETSQRVYEATQNWIKDGKKPYGLALPGTSGAPVFVRVETPQGTKEFLLGIVTSYGHLSGQFETPKGLNEEAYLIRSPQKGFNNYQTIFALFYHENTHPLAYTPEQTFYQQDPTFAKLLQRIQQD